MGLVYDNKSKAARSPPVSMLLRLQWV